MTKVILHYDKYHTIRKILTIAIHINNSIFVTSIKEEIKSEIRTINTASADEEHIKITLNFLPEYFAFYFP